MAPTNPTKVITGEVRLSYVYVLDPRPPENEGDKPKYSCLLLIPKEDTETLDKLRKAAAAATAAGIESGKLKPGTKPSSAWTTLKDGDEHEDVESRPEYADHWYMNVSAVTKPGVIDTKKRKVESADEIYSGVYARVSLNAYAFAVKTNKGVTFGLNNIQVIRDGDRLGGRARAEDDFDEYDDGWSEEDDPWDV